MSLSSIPEFFALFQACRASKAGCQAINQETEKADPFGSAFPAFASVISCSLQMPPGAADWEWQLMDCEIQLLHTAVGHLFFLTLDHSPNHFTANGACLGTGKVTVVTLFQVHTDFAGNFHFASFACGTSIVELELFVIVTPPFFGSFYPVSERTNKTCFLKCFCLSCYQYVNDVQKL